MKYLISWTGWTVEDWKSIGKVSLLAIGFVFIILLVGFVEAL